VQVPADDQLDFDRDGMDPLSADTAAATVIRRLASQLEQASFQARHVRSTGLDSAERARRLDFALVHLASVMSETEVIGLVNALRYAATTTQDTHVCEFCGSPTEPWSMLTGDPDEAEEDSGPLIHHAWDQYGVTLCKHCHFIVRKARWQLASPM
jgi:hypothetical protein